jgi:NADH dehydrogenase
VTELVPGPIAITGASGQVGTALRRRLAAHPNEVRALGREDDLATAFRDAVAVVHLAGALRPRPPDSYEDANLGTVERTIAALAGSTVERIVFLSYVGAQRNAANAYLRAKAEAEHALHRAGRDLVVFRCTHVFGPPTDPGPTVAALLAEKGHPVWVLGPGTQRLAPVYREDVADAIVAALAPAAYHGRFDLPGPEVLTMDELVRVVNGGSCSLHHVPPLAARALGRVRPDLTPELVDVLLADSLGDQIRADRTFGLARHGVSAVYSARPARAA